MQNPFSKTVTSFLVSLVVALNVLFPPVRTLVWDAFGYYLYLPLACIHHELRLENIDVVRELFGKYNPSSTFYQMFRTPEGYWIIRKTMGLALMQAPFFLIAHLIALLSDFPADGFSLPYQKAVWIGGIFYVILALITLRKILLNFFSDRTSALVMLITVLGTNYLYYVTYRGQCIGQQIFGFTYYVFIILFTLRWHRSYSFRDLIPLALFCGINILSRPTEAVCLFIPLLWGVYDRKSFSSKLRLLFEKRGQILAFAAILIAIFSMQLIYWKATSGRFFFNSYGNNAGEGLDFLTPHLFKSLFSFRKGWLIYTPVMFLALFGFAPMYKRNRAVFYPVLFYSLANLYLLSCWTTWWYGFSFGLRPLITLYAILVLPIGYFLTGLQERKWIIKGPVYGLTVLLIGLNLFQTWQYKTGILDGYRMTPAYYFRIFGKTRVEEGDRKLLLVDRSQWPVEHVPDPGDYSISRIYFNSYADTGFHPPDSTVYFRLDPERKYTPAFRAVYGDLTRKDHFYARASAGVFIPDGYKQGSVLMVMTFKHKEKLYKYNTMTPDPDSIRYGAWNRLSMDYLSPEIRSPDDQLQVYLWYRGDGYVLIRNLEILLFELLN